MSSFLVLLLATIDFFAVLAYLAMQFWTGSDILDRVESKWAIFRWTRGSCSVVGAVEAIDPPGAGLGAGFGIAAGVCIG